MTGVRCAIIIESDDGVRMIYELAPDHIRLEHEHDEIRAWGVAQAIRTMVTKVSLEGTLLHGTIWHGPMPADQAAEVEAPRLQIEGARP